MPERVLRLSGQAWDWVVAPIPYCPFNKLTPTIK